MPIITNPICAVSEIAEMWKFSNKSSPNTTQSDSDESLQGVSRTETEHSSNLETASRAELVRYVQLLTKQSGTYERRFKDVVRAYKHLQTERDTLETSLKASLTQRVLSRPTGTGGESEGKDNGAVSDEVSVLTQAVATLTEEKARIESNYQEDKKQSIQEQKSERNTLTDNLEQAEKDLSDLLKERQALKEEVVKLRSENSLLSRESDELRERTGELDRGVSERESRYLQQILSLQRQVEEASECCRVSELKAEETERMLREQRGCLGDQELNISKIESELRLSNKQRHDSSVDLERRVAELSELVGQYQTQVARQERKIAELRQETHLTPQPADNSSQLEAVIQLSEQENVLRTTLHTILKHALLGESVGVDEVCAMSTSELLKLLTRERPEVTAMGSLQTDSDKLCEEMRVRLEETERASTAKERDLVGQLTREREEGRKRNQLFERDTERKEVEFRSKLGALESQLIRLREHTSALLADKDSEICRLKNRSVVESLPSRDQQPTESAVNQFMSVSGYYSDNNTSLHLSQTKHREKIKQREAVLRVEEAQSAVKDVETREIKHLEQLSFLQNEINRLDNSLARQGTSLEYLKNVVLQFVTGGSTNRKELLVPLSTVLKLSADESRALAKSVNLKW